MSGNNKNDSGRPFSEVPEKEALSLIAQLKSSKRDEFLAKLTSLLALAFQEGSRNKRNEKIRQRWFTICGYLAQVAARVVTDLEYEKLRAEVEEMKRRIQDPNVIRPRRTTYSARAGSIRKITRKSHT